ncbi:MAG: putative Ig domain-containing protein [Candidatus Devosia phytovorans]|uniref:Ig domain-containing protein n=1 Tax=Candidatus Devosia phytovorans TaxID=3121372 RepID=A0AAJ5VWJ1_9HYPH|nr:putative Ig domain-containing protein [Devosia sp.]WEK06206.1 MAG: putative Ig domain-containing protein [Devosia sp.]
MLEPATLTVPGTLEAATFGADYQASLAASGGTEPYQYAVSGTLPAGVEFDPVTGVLSGVPRVLGTFPLTLSIVDTNGFSLVQAVELVVAAPDISAVADLPDGGAFVPYSGQVTASGGTAPYSFAVSSGALPLGLSLDPETGSITGTPRVVSEASFAVTVTDADGFSVSVPLRFRVAQVFSITLPADLATARQFQPYGQVLAAAGGTAPYAYAVSDGALPEGLVLDEATGTISGTPSLSGDFAFALTATDANGVGGSVSYRLVVAQAADLVIDETLAPAVAGEAYDQALVLDGGTAPYRFTLVSGALPEGLSFDPSTGRISGTASEDGNFPLAIRITDSNGDSATRTVVLTVEAPEIGVVLELPAVVAGSSFAGSVQVTGGAGPLQFALSGGLPDGLVFDEATGAISGTPVEAGAFPFTITVTDANGYVQSAMGSIVVTAETALSLSASRAEIRFGESVELAATVSSAAKGVAGRVIFAIDGVERAGVPLVNGVALLSLDGLTVGPHNASARFEPAEGFVGSSAELAGGLSVVAADSAVAAVGPAGEVAVGAPAQFVVSVSSEGGFPQGEVVPIVDGIELAPVVLVDGQAAFEHVFVTAGSHAVSVRYAGSDSFAAGIGVVEGGITVFGAASELTLSASPVAPVFGQPVVVTANVSSSFGVPGGHVMFSRAGAEIATVPLVDGVASVTLTDLPAGLSSVDVSYQGDAARLAAAAQIEISNGDSVTTLGLSADPARIYEGASVTLTATIGSGAGPVTGSMVFTVGEVDYPASITGGVASVTLDELAVGSYPVAVRFSGLPGFAASEAVLASDFVVEPAPSDIVVSAQVPRSVAGESVVIPLSVAGGVDPYVFSVAGDLPDGLSLDPATGTISGTPSQAGTLDFTVTATGSAGAPGSVAINLLVLAPAEIVVSTGLDAVTFGAVFEADLSASGGTAPYSYQLSGNLPDGVSFDVQTGRLSGTPTALGQFDLTLIIKDANGFVLEQALVLSVVAPVVTVSAELPEAGAFVPYSGQVSVTGGSAPYGFAVTSGALPDGLSLDPQSGLISGTPRVVAEAEFTVTATDANGFSASLPISLAVAQVFTVTLPQELADGRQAQPYGQTLAASGGTAPYSYAITGGALPAGLELDPQTGAISGTPVDGGSSAFSLTASDANGVSGTADYVLVVAQAATLVPETALESPVAGTPYRQVLAVSGGRSPYRFALVSGALPAGMTFDAASGTIAGTPTEAGVFGFVIAISDAEGDSVTQSFVLDVEAPSVTVVLDLPQAGSNAPFQGTVLVSGGAQPFQFALSGALPAGLTFDPQSGGISGTPTEAGSFPISIIATDANGFSQSADGVITVEDTAPPVVLEVGEIDQEASYDDGYVQTISVTGGTAPYAFSVAAGALPEGLTLDSSTGVISGTPRETGRFSVIVDVTDSAGRRVQRSFALQVSAPAFVPQFPAAVPPATGSEAYSGSVAVTGPGPLSYAVTEGALPPGLTLDPATGALSGTPSAAGRFAFEITATDVHQQSASADYSLVVSAPEFAIEGALPDAMGGADYGATLLPSGGRAPYRLVLTSPLPGGLQFDTATGQLSGTPTVAGTFEITLEVTDASGFVNTVSVPLSIAAPAIAFDGSLPAARVGTGFLFTPAVSGGSPDYRFAVVAGALPSGLTLDPATGSISGTSTLEEIAGFTLAVTDSNGFSAERTFSLAVASNLGSATLPASVSDGQVGMTYVGSVAASGGEGLRYAISSGALPDGLTLDAATGAISGTPEQAGTALFTVTATDGDGRLNAQSYVMAVAEPAMIIDNGFPPGTIGQSYSDGIAVSGGIAPYRFTLSNAPRDLTIDPQTGVVSGLPRETGSFDVVITVVDAAGHTSRQASTLTVQRRALALVLRDIDPSGWTGEDYDSSIAATNGVGTVTYEIVDGELPDGVTMTPDGALVGSPRRVGRWAFTVRATDSEGNTGTRAYSMETAESPEAPSDLDIDVVLRPPVAAIGNTVRVEVTVSNGGEAATSGSVSLRDAGSGEIVDSTLIGSSGTATFTLIAETAGDRSFVVDYSGSPEIAAGSSDPVTLTTNAAETALSLSADPDSPAGDETTTLSARVDRVAPAMGLVGSGNVVFSLDGAEIATVPVSNGVATTTVTLRPGSRDISARFEPDDGNDLPSEDALSVSVSGTASVTLSGPQGPVPFQTPLTYTATVAASPDGDTAPTGTVVFVVDGADAGSASLSNGSASLTLDPLPAGPHQVSARYEGDGVYGTASSQPVSVVIEPEVLAPQASTTALSPNTATPVVGDAVTLTAMVTGSQALRPTGTVRFIDQTTGTGIGTGTLNGDGQATLLHRFTTADTRTISAEYLGDASNLPSRDQIVFNVVPSPTQISLTAGSDTVSPEGTTALTAAFSRMPDGRGPPRVEVIEFRADNVVFASVPVDGQSEVTVESPPIGMTTEFTAALVPEDAARTDLPSTSAPVLVGIDAVALDPTTTVLTIAPNPSQQGDPVTLSAQVNGTAGPAEGSVRFVQGPNVLGTEPLVGGVATLTVSTLPPGTSAITAQFLANATYDTSTDTGTATVTLPPGMAYLTISGSAQPNVVAGAGQPVSLTFQIGAVGGTVNNIALSIPGATGISCPAVTLADGATMQCTATYVTSFSDVGQGNLSITATVTGDGVEPASTTISVASRVDEVVETFEDLTNQFISARARMVTGIALPNVFDRRIAPSGNRLGSVNAQGSSTGQTFQFATSLEQWRGFANSSPDGGPMVPLEASPFNAWVDVRLALQGSQDDEQQWSRLAVAAAGVDLLVNDNLLIGVAAQGDWMVDSAAGSEFSGVGYLIGPYASIGLAENLSLDLALFYGQSFNEARADIGGVTYLGSFETDRLLASAGLSGFYELDEFILRPSATFFLSSERSDAYVVSDADGNSVPIPSQEILDLQLRGGLTIERTIELDDGAKLTPMVGLNLSYGGTLGESGFDDRLTGGVMAGLLYDNGNFSAKGSIEAEFGADGFEGATGRITISGKF